MNQQNKPLNRVRPLIGAGIILFLLFGVCACSKPQSVPGDSSPSTYVEPHRAPLLEYMKENYVADSGARAVTDASLLQSHPIDVPDFMAICNITSAGITSADLINAAQRAKLRMEPVKLGWDQLVEEKRPVILAFPNNQFAVADPRDRQTSGG